MPVVDDLQIKIQGDAVKANDAIDRLIGKLDRLSTSLNGLSGKNLSSLSSGVTRLSSAMATMNSVKTADFTRLATNITKLSALDAGKISQAAGALHQFVNSLGSLNNVKISDTALHISELAKGIAQLGYKSSTQAVKNIPLLAQGMLDLMTTLSGAPKVSQNLIDMTNALARLARTGSSSGKAATSLGRSLDTYTKSSKRAKIGTFSLASAIGKLYATYWMLFRAFGKIKEAIDISSKLTEVQNVVDVTFGKYADLVDKMSEISINQFGMSELSVKKISSTFQAMGTAMGFAQGKMADMSIELTKLTADMASFYNVEQDAVAEDLASIFTGSTRPLRQYGLDLTHATLQEWAMKQGIDANVKSMSQAEKTMLRYQYVLANTGAAQGDFLRTADTWANQTRILKQNLQQLGAVIGGTFINMLKPFVKALNNAMSHIIAFAKVVSNALGKIFGWTYEEGSGGIANDMEEAADSSADLAGGLSDAEKNAKKLKTHLLGIDELNVLEPDTGDAGNGSGGGGGAGTGGASADGGQWVKADSIFKKYESEIDTLFELGEKIGETLTKAMDGINWEKIYKKAEGFGRGLAQFLNGLISPELFGAVGRTIASSLNTAIYTALSFAKTFNFHEFGVSLATSVNEFFRTFDFVALAEGLNEWVDGLKETIAGFLKTLSFDKIVSNIDGFLDTLEIDTVAVIIGAFTLKSNAKLLLSTAITKNLLTPIKLPAIPILLKSFAIPGTPAFDVAADQILTWIEDAISKILPEWAQDMIGNIVLGMSTGGLVGSAIPGIGTLAGLIIGGLSGAFLTDVNGSNLLEKLLQPILNFDRTAEIFEKMKKHFQEGGWNIVLGIGEGILSALSFLTEPITDLFDFFINTFCGIFGIHSPAESTKPLGENIFLGILEGFRSSFTLFTESITQFWEECVAPWFTAEKWLGLYDTIKSSLQTKWEEIKLWWSESALVLWWSEDVAPWFTLEKWTELLDTIPETFKTKWNETKLKWNENLTKWWGENVAPWFTKERWLNTLNTIPTSMLTKWNTTASTWKTNIKTWWTQNVAPWFTKERWSEMLNSIPITFKEAFKNAVNTSIGFMNGLISGVEELVNGAIDAFNELVNTLNPLAELLEITGISLEVSHVSLPRIPTFEKGGFPDKSSLFWANEHGIPELVGTIGNQPAVSSGTEITGIRDAVYTTGQEEASLLRTMVSLLEVISEKELSVSFSDREIAKASERGRADMGYALIV